MEYRKHIESKIIRTEHHVVIWPGGSAASLKTALQKVPLDAKLLDIVHVGDTSQINLVFTDEDAVETTS